jgi:hypothetical protein
MLTDAAMLFWLDGVRNSAGAANENLSREFMALFTLGHGIGYSEEDVRQGARALTGWFIGPGGKAEIATVHHDSTDKTVMGVTGDLDESGFCNIVLSQPNSAHFVASKLWRMLASDSDPSAPTLGRLVSAYGPGRDLKSLTKAILLDPRVRRPRGHRGQHPRRVADRHGPRAQGADRRSRAVGARRRGADGDGSATFLSAERWRLAQGQAWLSTSSISARAWAADKFTKSGDVSVVEQAAAGDRIDAAGYLLGIGAWTDRTAAALKPIANNPRRLVAAAVNTPEYPTS